MTIALLRPINPEPIRGPIGDLGMIHKLEFKHQVSCGTHRFYPRSRNAKKLVKLAQRKCLRTLDLQLIIEMGMEFQVFTETHGTERAMDREELTKILQSPYKEPKSV